MKYFCDSKCKVHPTEKLHYSHHSSPLCLIFSEVTNCSEHAQLDSLVLNEPVIRMVYKKHTFPDSGDSFPEFLPGGRGSTASYLRTVLGPGLIYVRM